jgi:hypothetical protein
MHDPRCVEVRLTRLGGTYNHDPIRLLRRKAVAIGGGSREHRFHAERARHPSNANG